MVRFAPRFKLAQSNDPVARRIALPDGDWVAVSRGAHSSAWVSFERDLMFDIGLCPVSFASISRVFITHAHDDHALGALRHLQYRHLFGMEPAVYHLPQENAQGFIDLISAWKVFKGKPPTEDPQPVIRALAPGDEVDLGRGLAVRTFECHHRIPCLGFHLCRASEGAKNAEDRLALLSYLGDHTIETLHVQKELGQSQALCIELTFLEPAHLDSARKHLHLHLDDLVGFAMAHPSYFQNKTVVVKHLSMRYSRRHIASALRKRLPESLKSKVIIVA